MKRSSPPKDVSSRVLIVVAAVVTAAVAACGPGTVETTHTMRGSEACAALDSVLARVLPPQPWECSGKATFDVADYRVRGRYRLAVAGRDSIAFEFEGTMLFGGHREDVAVSLVDDTLRVLDRERGAYYAGAQVDELIQRGTGVSGRWVETVRAIVGFTPSCTRRLEMRAGGDHTSGLIDDGAFVLTTDGLRLLRASWPDPTGSPTYTDRLDIRYDWDQAGLAGIRAALPKRGWRIVLTLDQPPGWPGAGGGQ